MRRGLLHKRLPNKGLVVDMRLLNTVLLQVAHSLQHLHAHDVIHSDVKCENVLLASSCSSPIGFVCKLGE
jgi:serine/threonine protein kinase